MQTARRVICSFLLLAVAATAQQKEKTDAEGDGFQGPVRSVSTLVERAKVKWQEPGGPTLVMPIYCEVCEYDPDGTRTRKGQITEEGKFLGENIKIVRDSEGHVIQRSRISTTDGQVFDEEKDGPFGPVENIYSMRPIVPTTIVRTTRIYDRLGNLAELLSFDASGQQVERDMYRTDSDGQQTEHAVWGRDGQLEYRQTYDPETDFQRFESFDSSGAPKVTYTFAHGTVLTFWSATDEPNQYGDSFSDGDGNGNFNCFHCHKGGDCEISRVRYSYANSTKHWRSWWLMNPTTVERRDSEGTLRHAAYYQYEFDDHHNWTTRTIWVLSPEIPKRTLYETDTRVITYWER